MKKIFTLIAGLLLAGSMNAKETLDISSLYTSGTTVEFTGGWQWKGIHLSVGEVVENQDTKTADDSGVTYFDASAYDYLVLKYSASTCDVNCIVQLNCLGTVGQWGAEFNQSMAVAATSPTGGLVGVKLDPAHKNTVMQFAFQNQNSAGSITIDEVYWASEAEYEAAGGFVLRRPQPGQALTVWEGSLVFDSWSVSTVIEAGFFDVAEVGDVIRVNIADPASPTPVFKYNNWNDFTALQNTKVQKDTYFECTIVDAEALAELQKNGLRLMGIGFTMTSVDLIARIDYQEKGTEIAFEENGNIRATAFEGFSDLAKVVFTTTITNAASFKSWGYGKLTSIGGEVMVGEMSVIDEGDNQATFLIADLKEALAAPGFYIDEATGERVAMESGLNWLVWDLNQQGEVSTPVRKSVVVYEVVGVSAVKSVEAALPVANGNIYNLAGQKVDAAYKGIVIKNGKKVVVK